MLIQKVTKRIYKSLHGFSNDVKLCWFESNNISIVTMPITFTAHYGLSKIFDVYETSTEAASALNVFAKRYSTSQVQTGYRANQTFSFIAIGY